MDCTPTNLRDTQQGKRGTNLPPAFSRCSVGRLLLMCCAAMGLSASAFAQVRPFVPSLDCCPNQYDPCCPSKAASCIPLPTVRVPEDQVYVDPTSSNRWPITVYEAIGIALNNSEVVRNLGLVEARSKNDLVQSSITTYDPLIGDAEAAAEWGIFDPLWTTEMNWDRQDIPPGVSFSGIGNRPPQLDNADFYTSIEQLLPGGTRFGMDEVVNYLFNPARPVGLDPNPQYYSYTQFRVTQPLLRNFGMNANMAKIRIAAAEAERTDWEFKTETLALVRSVETAYWDLYAQEQNLKALDEVLPQFREIVRIREQRRAADAGTSAELSQAKAEMYRYEQARLEIISSIAEQRLVLRNLMGLKPGDGTLMTTMAVSTLSPPLESLEAAVYTALRQRPDVLRQRLAVYVAKQEETLACNNLKPLLDFNAFWRINGLGDDLGSSFGVQTNDDYNSWNLGLTFQVPLGRREAKSNVRSRQLNIRKERALLDQVAHQASFQVADAHRRIVWLYQQYDVAQNRVTALQEFGEAASARLETPPPGMTSAFAMDLYLRHMREYTDSMYHVNAIVADFNSAVARFEEVKGTLLGSRLVEIEGDGTSAIPEEVLAPEDAKPVPAAQPAPAEPQVPAAPEQPLTQAQPRTHDPAAELRQPASAPHSIYNLPPDPVAQQPAPATPAPATTPKPVASAQAPEVAILPGIDSATPPVSVAPQRSPAATPAPTFVGSQPQPVAQTPAFQPEAPVYSLDAPSTIAVPPVAEAPVAPAPVAEARPAPVAPLQVPAIAQPDMVTGPASRELSPAPQGLRRPTTTVRPYTPPAPPQSVAQSAPRVQPLPAGPASLQPLPEIAMGPIQQPTAATPPAPSQPRLQLQQPSLAPHKLQQPTARAPMPRPQPMLQQPTTAPREVQPPVAQTPRPQPPSEPKLTLQQPSLAPYKLQQPVAQAPMHRPQPQPELTLQQPGLAPYRLQQPLTQLPRPQAAQPLVEGPALQQPATQPAAGQPAPIRWQPLAQKSPQPLEFSRETRPAAQQPPALPEFEIRQVPSQPSPALAHSAPRASLPAIEQYHAALANPLALVPADRYRQPRWRPLEDLQASRQVAELPSLEITQPISTLPSEVATGPIPFVAVMQPQALVPGDSTGGLVNVAHPQAQLQLQQPKSQQPQLNRSTYERPPRSIARESLSQPTFVR